MADVNIYLMPKQQLFVNSKADEVLFGGAAGGGKSHGQVLDAFIYAMKYPKSKQIIFRRTFPQLEMSIIRTALEILPRTLYKYNSSKHSMTFINGSVIDFGYCDNVADVYNYQSAEFDVIRFDELTHFSEDVYTYMISRLRGTMPYPRSVKSSTNPGGVGHTWVKERFIEIGPPNKVHKFETGTRIFIPSKIDDNWVLMKNDPTYLTRLENLSEKEKRALRYGDWDIEGGFFFDEFDREKHVCEPFEIPADWRRYRTIDYGLDCFAVLWVAVNSLGECYVYREMAQKDMIITDAAEKATDLSSDETIYTTYAPPDLWSRSQESGKSRAELFRQGGLKIQKSDNNRVAGWACIKEMLKPNQRGEVKLRIFNTCTQIIKHLSSIQVDEKNPNDCATQPHDITHLPDALRYFAVMHYRPNANPKGNKNYDFDFQKPKKKNPFEGDDVTKFLRR